MNDTLVVEILKALKDLRHVYADEVLREFAVLFADRVQGSIFAVFENDVEAVLGLDEADILDDVVMMQIFEKIDFGLNHEQLALGQTDRLDLLDRHGLASPPVEGFENSPEGALADAVAESL